MDINTTLHGMTVGELIKTLQKFPQDYEVYLYDNEGNAYFLRKEDINQELDEKYVCLVDLYTPMCH